MDEKKVMDLYQQPDDHSPSVQGKEQTQEKPKTANPKTAKPKVDAQIEPHTHLQNAMPIIVACTAITNKDGKILLIRRSRASTFPGEWEQGGGHIEPGETPQAAAIREAKEETGLKVELAPKNPVYFALRDGMGQGVMYRAKRVGGYLKLSDEHDKYKWVDMDEVTTASPTPPDFAQNMYYLFGDLTPKEIAAGV